MKSCGSGVSVSMVVAQNIHHGLYRCSFFGKEYSHVVEDRGKDVNTWGELRR